MIARRGHPAVTDDAPPLDEALPPADERRLTRLLEGGLAADYELDLKGLDLPHSLASIDRMVERQRFRGKARSVFVGLDPATADSGQTLFQPVGRHLLGLMRRGLVAQCKPQVGAGVGGFLVLLPAGKEDLVP